MELKLKHILIACSKVYAMGAYWSLVPYEDKELIELLQGDTKGVRKIEALRGVIIEIEPSYFNNTLESVSKELIADIDFKKAYNTRLKREQNRLKTFLQEKEVDQLHFIDMGHYYEVCFGLYTMNTNDFILINGQKVQSFRLTLTEMFNTLVKTVGEEKLHIPIVKGEGREGKAEIVSCEEIIKNNMYKQMSSALRISPTETGVFMTVIIEK